MNWMLVNNNKYVNLDKVSLIDIDMVVYTIKFYGVDLNTPIGTLTAGSLNLMYCKVNILQTKLGML